MDKVRVVLQFLKKQHFWLLSGLVVLIGLLSWYMASGDLSAAYETNSKKFNDAKSGQERINSTSPHANDQVIQAQRQEAKALQEVVRENWGRLYKQQQDAVLKWPTKLRDDFRKEIVKYKFGEELPPHLKRWMPDHYMNYIKERVRELPEIVQAQDIDAANVGATGEGPMRGGGATGVEAFDDDFLVIWQDYYSLEAKTDWQKTPQELQIWVAQESLWVYETLLRAIAAVNASVGATGNHDAAIRIIHQLSVGQDAIAGRDATMGRILVFADVSAGMGDGMRGEGDGRGGMPGGPGGMSDGAGGGLGMPGGMDGRGGRGDGGGMLGEAVDLPTMLLSGRYLDAQGQPILEANVESTEEFKRLPVAMVLTMDQRYLQRLIIECANAPLPIEIDQVRVNVGGANGTMGGMGGGRGEGGGGFGRGGGGGGGLGGGMGPGGGMGGMGPGGGYGGGGGGRSGQGGDTGVAIEVNPEPNIVTIILHGTVYIYNPPSDAKLNLPAIEGVGGGEPVADGTNAGMGTS